MDIGSSPHSRLASRRVREQRDVSDDDVLMPRIAKGDRDAAQALMSRNLPRILGLARRTLGDEIEAEDVAQETFIRVWKAASRWEPGKAQVSTWMCRIAINLCYDRLRKRREVLTDEVPEQADEAPDQELVMRRAETGDRIARALGELPDRQRQAIELVHFQELSNIAAAEIMEVSVDAMESLLARGRRKLKAILAGDASGLMESYTGQSNARHGAT
ncbi:RNA polymerase sigma factor [Maricaulis parjimensis]|uniref:RNA polymerase sigma factor n=1 Tax=Maricaulis parjimensis TaxID=144023 RepID=UPI001EED9DDB|nr:RNA polymerase sigma factor [Maricaulis parjimensis]